MTKNFFSQLSAVCLAAMIFVFAGCQDKDYYDPTPDPEPTDGPSLLNFSTSQDVKLNLTYADVPQTFISVFDVYTENPMSGAITGQPHLRTDLTPIAGGIAVGGQIEINKTVPAGAKELYLYSPDLFIPSLFSAKIENGVANFNEVDLSTLVNGSATTRTLGDNKVDGYLNDGFKVGNSLSVNNSHRPTYLDKSGIISNTIMNTITSAFPNGQKADEQYYEDALIELHESAEVWVSVIHSDGSYNSALSYFCFEGTKEELASASKDVLKEIVAFPSAKLSSATYGLKKGNYVKLLYFDGTKYIQKFPEGVTIGFVLRADGYNTSTKKLKNPDGIYYSYNAWNPEPEGYSKQHTIYFNAETDESKDPFICFGFEDMANDPRYERDAGPWWNPGSIKEKYAGDGDCNDVMFHVDINPITAIDPPPPAPVPGTRYHTESRKGTLAFEDNWPKKGDYDLNDVVVKYESKTTYIQATEDDIPVGPITLSSLEDKITLVHSGADYKNTFAYKLNINPSVVESININGANYTPIADGDGFIIKICDDVATEVNCVKSGASTYTCTPKAFDIQVKFKNNSITQADFNNKKCYAPYNPYIIPDNKKGYEVHLPYYPPTDNFNKDLFYTEDDRSVDGSGIWFVGDVENPYPFAIHLFNVDGYKKMPVEQKEIDYTYPEFTNWVSSKFEQSLDWFEHPANVD